MEFRSTSVYLGNYKVKTSLLHYKVLVSKSSFRFKVARLSDNEEVPVVILAKDINSVGIDMLSTSAYMCLTLTRAGCSRIRTKIGMNKSSKYQFDCMSVNEEERRIFIFIDQVDMSLVQCIAVNTAAIRHKSTLEHEESTELLRISKLSLEKSIHDIEHVLVQAAEKQSKKTEKILMQHFNYRKWSSFVTLFKDVKMTKAEFVKALDTVNCLGGLENFLHSIFWFEAVYLTEVDDYVLSLVCHSGCGGKAFLKCSSCRVARYCKEECQEEHFQEHGKECEEMKEERKRKKKQEFLEEVYPVHETGGVSYDFFISKLRSKMSHLLRVYLKIRFSPEQVNNNDGYYTNCQDQHEKSAQAKGGKQKNISKRKPGA